MPGPMMDTQASNPIDNLTRLIDPTEHFGSQGIDLSLLETGEGTLYYVTGIDSDPSKRYYTEYDTSITRIPWTSVVPILEKDLDAEGCTHTTIC